MRDNRKMKDIIPVIAQIKQMMNQDRIILAIDGNAASGKTTLAASLAQVLDAAVIHMDDFFLPENLRTQKRRQEAGGNIHYERFQEEVIQSWIDKKEISYRRFDCSVMDYGDRITVKPSRCYVVEGVYCMHPYFGDLYDLKIFCSISKEKQEERILKRNGREGLAKFKGCWIPMENRYFETYAIREHCDFVIEDAKEGE